MYRLKADVRLDLCFLKCHLILKIVCWVVNIECLHRRLKRFILNLVVGCENSLLLWNCSRSWFLTPSFCWCDDVWWWYRLSLSSARLQDRNPAEPHAMWFDTCWLSPGFLIVHIPHYFYWKDIRKWLCAFFYVCSTL